MKKTAALLVFIIISIFRGTYSFAQLPLEIRSGLIYVNDGTIGKPNANKYSALSDSLDKVLKLHPNDTTCLYLRAVLYLQLNKIISNPDVGNKMAFGNLVIAKDMAEKAVNLKMENLYLKVLRAELYKELTNRFMADQAWKFTEHQIAERKSQFDNYKAITNKYYDELAVLDKQNAYDYQKLRVNGKYPL
ncbi:hypothetical protein [Mucilaginibacter segetis]|uniref:Tetratricopeptide repeat protein n=1 Tax=Mucilaginibacter segetis TaxID=2793071 RepID=A0A934PVV4_9SPHI|nr:hypothetical protein [Mucilaginibacter segetis]MBK0380060.1 hypothetical protein [Mucilaginibacter segetis]